MAGYKRLKLIGFIKNPANRPRLIIWALAAVLGLAAVVIVALGITSTTWFCAEGCHKVQDDTIMAYERSTHSEISCMACHMPVNADPVTFVLHKMEALLELYMTVTNTYELPLNGESLVALEMKEKQCTQCHDLKRRPVTPSVGILIDHKKHAEKEVVCTVCHNRVAHNEDFKLTLKDPGTGEPNRKHEDFMGMTACFRCHAQPGDGVEREIEATGTCGACHPAGFQLKPASHSKPDFFPANHAKLAAEEASRVALAVKHASTAAEEESGHGEEPLGVGLPKAETLNECWTCHAEKFCSDCHKLPMPHPADFKEGHGDLGKKSPAICANCHGDPKQFCDECHHGTSMDWEYDTAKPWMRSHPAAVSKLGASTCFDCHDPTYCADCHVNGPGD